MDSNHLVMLGGDGMFGPSSPHHTHLNPPLAHVGAGARGGSTGAYSLLHVACGGGRERFCGHGLGVRQDALMEA